MYLRRARVLCASAQIRLLPSPTTIGRATSGNWKTPLSAPSLWKPPTSCMWNCQWNAPRAAFLQLLFPTQYSGLVCLGFCFRDHSFFLIEHGQAGVGQHVVGIELRNSI